MVDAGDLKGELERRQVNVFWTCRRFLLRGFRGVVRNPSVLDTQMDTDCRGSFVTSCVNAGIEPVNLGYRNSHRTYVGWIVRCC
jgi:hypothetical protein